MDENGRTSERVLEQLRLLLDAVASRAQGYLNGIGADGGSADGGAAGSGADGGGAAGGGADDGSAHCSGSAPCGWCPLCAAVSFARGSNPELASQLGEQVTGLVALLRQAVEQQSGAGAGDQRPQPPAVQHIDVQRVGDSVLQDGACGDEIFEGGVSQGAVSQSGVSQGGPVAERAGEREC